MTARQRGPAPSAGTEVGARPALKRDELPALPRLMLSGAFAEEVTVIPRSMSSLIFATGFLEDGKPVLLPFVEMMYAGLRQGDAPEGGEDPEGLKLETVFSRTLPLENALFLTYDIVRDIRISCARFRGLVDGKVGFDPSRIAHARYYAEQVRIQAELCAALLDELSVPMPVPESEPAPSLASPVRKAPSGSGSGKKLKRPPKRAAS
jgi:hypothetical protein